MWWLAGGCWRLGRCWEVVSKWVMWQVGVYAPEIETAGMALPFCVQVIWRAYVACLGLGGGWLVAGRVLGGG
jgi:hypothetical protein